MTEFNSTLSTTFSEICTDSGAQPECQERKVISRTRSQLPSNLRVLKSSRRKVIRKEMTTRSKEDSRRERSNNFQAFVKMALETLLGSCRRKHGGPRGRQG
ncbi:uncharacterized protein [Takifugu rubripes]|uniref:Uncharacterized protein n=1 Tax=Takifugu flavidus TaxID=433684 RepID=A0A5C6MRR3_9TELE|nr:uncharacterized protein LOC101072313 [Takifugu rubripes]TWW57048.1 hypothetical protein D4764_08G0010350 [Takifugu flavidus]|eukprot:XP_011601078.1 PREDICTED: uncharacterized protein LOC101072313 [Takifugu rubripes]